jgi:Arabinose efflux permease
MTVEKVPARLIWALGLTQIVGYGTLYYSFGVLAPAMAEDFGISTDFVFGLLSGALLAGGALAPKAGRWADRYGAGRLMAPGSIAAALALAALALASNIWLFSVALVAMELASVFVLYGTAFAALVQIGGAGGQRSITHLTLIAGFASTLFWPLTSGLQAVMDWREVYGVFALMNLALCLPVHLWVASLSRRHEAPPSPRSPDPVTDARPAAPIGIFPVMLAGFALEGFVLSAILVHMVPLMGAVGAGSLGMLVPTLFGPSQVASRLLNMIFGGRLSQTLLALISAGLLTFGALALLAGAPSAPGLVAFTILFGLGSGLASIVGGTLPLELFGRAGYGARLGWITAARQVSAALAPFLFAVMMARLSVEGAIAGTIATAVASLLCFGSIVFWQLRQKAAAAAAPA